MTTEALIFFSSPATFRAWLAKNHATASVLWVGYHKIGSGEPSLTWQESVDQALCYGWIDGLRKSIDATRYKIRFTPRRPNSIWSAVNIGRLGALEKEGLLTPAGREAFARRNEAKSGLYAHEQEAQKLPAAYLSQLEANPQAAAYFHQSPPGYQKSAVHWVLSAQQEVTRQKRLHQLIQDSAAAQKIPPLRRDKK